MQEGIAPAEGARLLDDVYGVHGDHGERVLRNGGPVPRILGRESRAQSVPVPLVPSHGQL